MAVEKDGGNPRSVLGSMLVGMAISCALYGVTSGQVVYYFRSQSHRNNKWMNALVWFVWVAEAFNCVFISIATWKAFIAPTVARTRLQQDACRDWSMPVQAVASSLCTFSVEGFFIMRMWRLSGRKKLVALAFIPYLSSYGFGFTQIIKDFKYLCNPIVTGLQVVTVYGAYGTRMFGDSVIVFTMCYMLYVRSLGFLRYANTIKIVRELIIWSISTGVLTWFHSAFFLACYLKLGKLPPSTGVYFIRAGLYSNAMLAQLNARTRFRAMAETTIPLALSNLNIVSSVQQQVNRESPQPANREPSQPWNNSEVFDVSSDTAVINW